MSETQPETVSKHQLRTAYILSGATAAFMAYSSIIKIIKPPIVVKTFEHLQWDDRLAPWLGVVQLICTVLYIIPRTAILGAILLTGFLGGAAAAHVRLQEIFIAPIILGIVFWLGLYLRDDRLRSLIPWRK